MSPVHECKVSGAPLENSWILFKLAKDGSVEEILLYPTTRLGTCAREAYLKDKFLPPPRPDYWVGIYMKFH